MLIENLLLLAFIVWLFWPKGRYTPHDIYPAAHADRAKRTPTGSMAEAARPDTQIDDQATFERELPPVPDRLRQELGERESEADWRTGPQTDRGAFEEGGGEPFFSEERIPAATSGSTPASSTESVDSIVQKPPALPQKPAHEDALASFWGSHLEASGSDPPQR